VAIGVIVLDAPVDLALGILPDAGPRAGLIPDRGASQPRLVDVGHGQTWSRRAADRRRPASPWSGGPFGATTWAARTSSATAPSRWSSPPSATG